MALLQCYNFVMHAAENGKPNNDVIQTLRTAHQNQTQLNLMADQKANILIGTLVLVYTVVLTRIPTLLTEPSAWFWPLIVLMVVQLVPLVLTVLVLIPKNIHGTASESIQHIQNPLFFGFFSRYAESQYVDYMQSQLTDNEQARAMLIKDLYQIGVILRRKYRLLRWAYLTALMGLFLPLVTGMLGWLQ